MNTFTCPLLWKSSSIELNPVAAVKSALETCWQSMTTGMAEWPCLMPALLIRVLTKDTEGKTMPWSGVTDR